MCPIFWYHTNLEGDEGIGERRHLCEQSEQVRPSLTKREDGVTYGGMRHVLLQALSSSRFSHFSEHRPPSLRFPPLPYLHTDSFILTILIHFQR
jgi:hypothetical protein